MKKIIGTVVAVAAVLVAVILVVAYGGTIDVGADTDDSQSVRWFLTTTRESSIEARASSVEPPELTPAMAETGLRRYHEMCVRCHGAPGVPPDEFARGLNPEAPELWTEPHDAGEAFWVVKHGLRMTGMPAFGATHSDDTLWPIVAFLEELPDLDAAEYARRTARLSVEPGHRETAGHEHGAGAPEESADGSDGAPAVGAGPAW